MLLNDSRYRTDDIQSRVRRPGDKLSASIRLPLIKQIDSGKYHSGLRIFQKLRGSVNKAERRKKIHKHSSHL
ncbi:Hypothetical predicted protein, partial [Xyrichtys novacula]